MLSFVRQKVILDPQVISKKEIIPKPSLGDTEAELLSDTGPKKIYTWMEFARESRQKQRCSPKRGEWLTLLSPGGQ